MQGQQEEGIGQMRQGLAVRVGTGAAYTYLLALLAEAYGTVGQLEQGLAVLAEALGLAESTGGRWWDAELYRLKGKLLLHADGEMRTAEFTPRSVFSEGHRGCPPSASKVLGTARRHQSESPMATPGQTGRSTPGVI
jgi:hypothetical protein